MAARQVPIYDFKLSRRVGYRTVEVPESRVVILEGIYALSQRIRWGHGAVAWAAVALVHLCRPSNSWRGREHSWTDWL